MTQEMQTAVRPTIGVIGLGLLGGALAVRLLHRGFAVLGYDIQHSRGDELAAEGVNIAASVAEVATGCQRVLLSLPTSEIVEEASPKWKRNCKLARRH
jgi:3-hydroxyisobutyrate dehydrogenase-like beta-hydroxyacid dehydrogenase